MGRWMRRTRLRPRLRYEVMSRSLRETLGTSRRQIWSNVLTHRSLLSRGWGIETILVPGAMPLWSGYKLRAVSVGDTGPEPYSETLRSLLDQEVRDILPRTALVSSDGISEWRWVTSSIHERSLSRCLECRQGTAHSPHQLVNTCEARRLRKLGRILSL